MSAIDQYNYTCLGLIECPVNYRFFAPQDHVQSLHIAIYYLRQDIPEYETDFQGKLGDVLVGGGGGEAPAMRIIMPNTILWATDWERYDHEHPEIEKLYSTYWSPTQSFILGTGFVKLGWNPEEIKIGQWLMEHVVSFLVTKYKDKFADYIGNDDLDYDGSICRLLTDEEDTIWN